VSAKQRMLFWIWLMMLVAYLDRFNINMAGPTIRHALHISLSEFGFVLSAFSVGYALMQAPGGYLADRFGARRLLVIALVAWSVFTALTGLAWSAASLIAIRILFGLCEGIENGAQFKLIGDNFDTKERSSANAHFLTALSIGPAIAASISAWLILHAGWRALFFDFAGVGLLVALLIYLFLPKQAAAPVIDDAHAAQPTGPGRMAVLALPATWLLIIPYLLFNVAFWGVNGWMPTYLSEVRGIDLKDLGTAAMIPYLSGFVGLIVIGALGRNPFSTKRPLLIGACYAFAAASLFAASAAHTAWQSVAGLSVAAFFLYGGFGPFWACVLDNGAAKTRGWFSGLVNFGGQLGGITAPIVIGYIVERTNSYAGAFLFMIGALVLSAISLVCLQSVSAKSEPL
jgi:sugar phosphate permease